MGNWEKMVGTSKLSNSSSNVFPLSSRGFSLAQHLAFLKSFASLLSHVIGL